MKPYSPEMRRDVLDMAAMGSRTHDIAFELGVSKSWVRRVKQEFRESGKTAPLETRRRARCWEPHADWLAEAVAARPDVKLRELKAAAGRERSWDVSVSTLCQALKSLRLTRKKRR